MADKIQLRRDTQANWASANPILAQGEIGYEIDNDRVKIGDGVTVWNSLPYKFDQQGDHSQLINLGADDHTQYLNETRHDGLPSDNPHGVTKSQVGLGNADNTSDADKPVSTATQTALDAKADESIEINSVSGETTGGGDLTANRSIGLADTAVTPGSFTNANVTVDAKGRITSATSGSAGVTDHGALTGLGEDDHTQYLNESRHDGLPADNPHSVTAAQVGSYTQAQADSAISGAIATHAADEDAHGVFLKQADLGWISVSSTASQSFNFQQRLKIPFTTGFSVLNTNGPAVAANWFDSVNSLFMPDSSGDFYSLRFSAEITANQGDKQVTLDLDIGGTQGIIWSTTIRTPKSGGQSTNYTLSIPVFTLGTFVANGGAFYGEFDTSGTIANPNLVICKVFKS